MKRTAILLSDILVPLVAAVILAVLALLFGNRNHPRPP